MNFFDDISKENTNHSLWTEKYRPYQLDDYIGNDGLKSKIGYYLKSNDIPHLLLFGRPGTGKSTAAKMIINTIECDSLFINASDENNVDTVRNKIKGFASTVGFKPLKIIVLDEADYLTPAGQSILRNLMETFSKHCRFILTCNYVEKVIDAIQSRCQTFEVTPPSKKEVAVHLSKILQLENIEADTKDIVTIIDSHYPDIRKIINTSQMSSLNGKLELDKLKTIQNEYKTKILDILKSDDTNRNKFKNIRQLIADSKVRDFTDIYRYLFDNSFHISKETEPIIILKLAEYSHRESFVIDKEIQFMGCIQEILEIK
jgi:replication factor C small subunit